MTDIISTHCVLSFTPQDPHFCNRGTTDGVFRCQRYFRCPPGAGLFVSLDKITVPVDDETDVNIKLAHGNLKYFVICLE